jgi:hypothetical protein
MRSTRSTKEQMRSPIARSETADHRPCKR